MFLRKIRQKVYTLRLDSIVKSDSSLSSIIFRKVDHPLDSIVKSDSSLSLRDGEALKGSLDSIVKSDSSLSHP